MKKLIYYLQLILVTPFWLLHISPTRKAWSEFKSGLIAHKCEMDYTNIQEPDSSVPYYSCKHHGCNRASCKDKEGNWIWDKKQLTNKPQQS